MENETFETCRTIMSPNSSRIPVENFRLSGIIFCVHVVDAGDVTESDARLVPATCYESITSPCTPHPGVPPRLLILLQRVSKARGKHSTYFVILCHFVAKSRIYEYISYYLWLSFFMHFCMRHVVT